MERSRASTQDVYERERIRGEREAIAVCEIDLFLACNQIKQSLPVLEHIAAKSTSNAGDSIENVFGDPDV